jgi:hypothetical protein
LKGVEWHDVQYKYKRRNEKEMKKKREEERRREVYYYSEMHRGLGRLQARSVHTRSCILLDFLLSAIHILLLGSYSNGDGYKNN